MNNSLANLNSKDDLEHEYQKMLNELNEQEARFKREIYEKEVELKKELELKLQHENELRSKQARKNIINSIVVTSTIIISTSAVYTSVIQNRREDAVSSILEKQVSFTSRELQNESLKAEQRISTLIKELKAQKDSLSQFSPDRIESNHSIAKDVSALGVRLVTLESNFRKFESSKLVPKMTAIEASIEGSPEKVLSVPLIKNDLNNFKMVSEKEILRLEKNIERLDGRLSFFVTTTVTLLIGILAAIAGPIFSAFSNKWKKEEAPVK